LGGPGTGVDGCEAAARRLHLVGIGGSGMASLAAYLLGRGEQVSGCDQKDAVVLRLLRDHGARIDLGHAASHLDAGLHSGSGAEVSELIHTAAAGADHAELRAAMARNVPTSKYAQFLGRETKGRHCLAVAGTHGKTTTSTLLAELLIGGGRDPSAVVGGFPIGWPLPGRAGAGPHFVVEACEYDRSFNNFAPHVALVTNVEPDHLDYFGSHQNVVAAFADFLRNTRPGGFAVVHESAARQLDLKQVAASVLVVGGDAGADARVEPLESRDGCARGRLTVRGFEPVELAPTLPGDHNLVNAALAATAALALGLEAATIEPAIRNFRGVRRRLEPLASRGGVRFLSDYAHHPTEIRAVRLALRASQPGRRLIVVFQPHQASRTRDFRDEFARELAQFDAVIVPNIFSVRESREGIEFETGKLLEAIAARGCTPLRARGLDDVFETVRRVARAGDLAILMGAGDIDDLAETLRGAAREAGVA
jgi:UDP-N-acetylmuramate--alanine ligase